MKKKKILIASLISLVIIIIILCLLINKNNALEKEMVKISLKKDSLTSTSLILIIKNNSDKEIHFGEGFTIEKFNNKKWLKLKTREDTFFNLIDNIVEKKSTAEQQISWDWIYGTLKPGKYRLVKEINNHKYYLEFKIASKKNENKIEKIIAKEKVNCTNSKDLLISTKEYKIYTSCLESVTIKIDLQEFSLQEFLKEKANLEKLIQILKEQTTLNDTTSLIYKDGGSTLYKGANLSLLKCNTIEGNKDIYIGSEKMYYEKNFCK